jgi:NADP-dependent 3-hydroxy acid dehydrogenase YdfG
MSMNAGPYFRLIADGEHTAIGNFTMVTFSDVLKSNAKIPSGLPKRLVAVFAGATSGIGEATLKLLSKYAVEPRIYLIARNQTSAERVIADCRQINPQGEYMFVQADLSSIRETDRACEHIKSKEKVVNLVSLSAGQFDLNKKRKHLPKHTLAIH